MRKQISLQYYELKRELIKKYMKYMTPEEAKWVQKQRIFKKWLIQYNTLTVPIRITS